MNIFENLVLFIVSYLVLFIVSLLMSSVLQITVIKSDNQDHIKKEREERFKFRLIVCAILIHLTILVRIGIDMMIYTGQEISEVKSALQNQEVIHDKN
jgi:uncharacterized membrane protein